MICPVCRCGMKTCSASQIYSEEDLSMLGLTNLDTIYICLLCGKVITCNGIAI